MLESYLLSERNIFIDYSAWLDVKLTLPEDNEILSSSTSGNAHSKKRGPHHFHLNLDQTERATYMNIKIKSTEETAPTPEEIIIIKNIRDVM